MYIYIGLFSHMSECMFQATRITLLQFMKTKQKEEEDRLMEIEVSFCEIVVRCVHICVLLLCMRLFALILFSRHIVHITFALSIFTFTKKENEIMTGARDIESSNDLLMKWRKIQTEMLVCSTAADAIRVMCLPSSSHPSSLIDESCNVFDMLYVEF
jgi:hypothetical protein